MTSRALERKAAAVFLDRDGTLMRDVEYCGDPARVEVFAGVKEALARLKAAGFKLIVITNQSGIGRGYFTEEDYHRVQTELERQLGGRLLDAHYFCPDHPENPSPRRKPFPEMIFEATRDLQIDLARSFMIGDRPLDAECGRRAGLRTILVKTGLARSEEKDGGDWQADNLPEAAEIILRHANA